MNKFHFLRPEWFLLLIPLSMIIWYILKKDLPAGSWHRACDPKLLPFLLQGDEKKRTHTPLIAIALAGFLATLALAGPVWRQLEQPVFRNSSPLVIALDLSLSMDAADIKPSRLIHARLKLRDILKLRTEGQTALLVYAAQPFVVTPLTDDTATIASQVSSLTTALVPSQGSRPDLAIAKAIELLSNGDTGRGDLLLITDGLGTIPARQLADGTPPGVRISLLGVGTTEGAPIPLPGGDFLKNAAGEIVIPQLDEAQLKKLAYTTGGRYSRETLDDSDIRWLLDPLSKIYQKEMADVTDFQADQWREEGPWLLLLLLPLCAFVFRRGYLLLLLFLTLPMPQSSYALDWNRLWSRPDQLGSKALDLGENELAADLFENREWKATAQYLAGKYQESLTTLQGLDSPRANYNRGNSLARLGKLNEAVKAYEKVLAQTPDDQDARHNLELVKELLDKQKSQQQQPSEQENSQQQKADNKQGGKASEQANEQQNKQQSPQQDSAPEKNQNAQSMSEKTDLTEISKETSEEVQTDQAREEGQPLDDQQRNAENSTDEINQARAEQRLADEHWLRRIPDDPGGLLRRKFRYQYQRTYKGAAETQQW